MIEKRVSLSVLERRPLVMSAFMPPVVPDVDDEFPRGSVSRSCLPPCRPFGAGGSMNGWGSVKTSLTKCDFCNNYFRSDSEFLGAGAGDMVSTEHCGYCGAHNRDEHTTKLWVNYPSIPAGKFKLRAKMSWDINGPDSLSVAVFSVETFPTTEPGGCEGSAFDLEWSSGSLVGRFVFVNDAQVGGSVTLGSEQYKYQDQPSDLIVDGNALGSKVLRFEITESGYVKAKFRAANLEWPAES